MDVNAIASLAKLMRETGLTSLELSEGETCLKLERRQDNGVFYAPAAEPLPAQGISMAASPAAAPAAEVKQEGTLVLSPTVGVFYSASSPESKPFVTVGSKVKKGDTLCIIEAMKLMNEIPAEIDGAIAEICVGNGQVVEYNQPLFRIV